MKYSIKSIPLLLINLFLFVHVNAQTRIDDYVKLSLAELQIAKANYSGAIDIIATIKHDDVIGAYEHIQFAKAYFNVKDSAKAKFHLIQAASKGYKLEWLKNKADFTEILSICDERYYENTYNEKLHKYTDIILYGELKSMFNLDQYLRKKWMQSGMKDSIALHEFRKMDTIHSVKILDAIATHGWQGHKNLFTEEYFFPLFLHISSSTFDSTTFEKYKPILLNEVLKGNLQPKGYALWIDRYMIWHLKQKATFGVFWENTAEGSKLAEVTNIEKLDSIRASIGLLSLKDDIELKKINGVNIIYPGWYTEK